MPEFTAADALKFLELSTLIYVNAKQARDAARALAEKAGVSEEDLAASDARFAAQYADPLA